MQRSRKLPDPHNENDRQPYTSAWFRWLYFIRNNRLGPVRPRAPRRNVDNFVDGISSRCGQYLALCTGKVAASGLQDCISLTAPGSFLPVSSCVDALPKVRAREGSDEGGAAILGRRERGGAVWHRHVRRPGNRLPPGQATGPRVSGIRREPAIHVAGGLSTVECVPGPTAAPRRLMGLMRGSRRFAPPRLAVFSQHRMMGRGI